MASLNKVILIGYMVADPELKQTQNGIPVCSFRIGVSRRMSKENVSDFIDIVTWRQQAEFVSRYFRKGSPICIVGSLQGRSWQDQQGQKRYTLEVVADEVSFVESKGSGNGAGAGNYGGAPSYTQNAQPQYTPYSGESSGYGQQPSVIPDNTPSKFEDLSFDDDLPF